ncbi:MAG: hypothetical protein KGI27_14875, partial [Thaumarchaeota archaeon]|nr:hypothetical protein [Nitrososphaerota archaeon]
GEVTLTTQVSCAAALYLSAPATEAPPVLLNPQDGIATRNSTSTTGRATSFSTARRERMSCCTRRR